MKKIACATYLRFLPFIFSAVAMQLAGNSCNSSPGEVASTQSTGSIQDTEYPIYGIVSVESEAENLDLEDYRYLASTYKMIYSDLSKETGEKLKNFNPDFQLIRYTNTAAYKKNGFPWSDIDSKFRWIEENNRRKDIAYYAVARLKEELSNDGSIISVKNGQGPFNNLSTVKASTTDGKYSVNSQEYVFWVRIGEELMRVNSIDEHDSYKELHVTRGFENTAQQQYDKGAGLFVPVYQAGRGYPGMEDGYVHYAADPATTLRRDLTFRYWEYYTRKNHFDGIWMDVFGASLIVGPGDANGNPVEWSEVWDFKRDTSYINGQVRRGIQAQYNYNRLTEAVDSIQHTYGEYPLLYANNIHHWVYEQNLTFFEPHRGQPMIKMYCQENATVHLNMVECWQGSGIDSISLSNSAISIKDIGSGWLDTYDDTRDAASRGYRVGPMMSSAGCQSPYIEELNLEDREIVETYHYASYLLAVDQDKSVWYGTPVLHESGGKRVPFQFKPWRWPIGLPQQKSTENFTNLKVHENPTLFGRKFENGYVLIYPDDGDPVTIDLMDKGGPYYDPRTDEEVRSVTLSDHRAKILLKDYENQQ